MPERPVPKSLSDLSPEFLTGALREGGHLGDARSVVAVNFTDVGTGRGFVGRTVRVALSYDADGADAPDSLIAKMPLDREWPADLQPILTSLFEVELGFYAEHGMTSPVRVPRPYWIGTDPDAGRFCLLLEDLGHLTSVAQTDGCSAEQAELAVRGLARIHARWWHSPAIEQSGWLLNSTTKAERVQATFTASWPVLVSEFGDSLSSELKLAGERVARASSALFRRSFSSAGTLIHGDYRVENFFFGPPGPDEFVVYDWQLSAAGPATYDLAYLLGQSLTIETRREAEERLLDSYLDELKAHGVSGYTAGDLLGDYRSGLLTAFGIPANAARIFTQMKPHENEDPASFAKVMDAGRTLTRTMVERSATAIEDHEAYRALDGL